MKNIRIERYEHPSTTCDWSGLIEGERADGSRWILFLDENGSPDLYWSHRHLNGGVLGDPITL
ncbi:hypothetical protein [Nocardia sp. NPDC004860]|uniref:hypothetical protein n=1 Tax=Nocardia sp. NPDC004860 TaxID=3154557 RepID=UPI0033AD9E9B